MDETRSDLSPAISELDELVDYLDGARARVANAFATEVFFFARVADLVRRRERERARCADDGSRVDASQLAMREVYAEIAAALQLSEYQVAARVSEAYTLLHHFGETLADASDGRMSPQHARAIAGVGGEIGDPAVRAEFEALARPMAGELTAAQLKVALQGLVSRLDPEGTQQRIRDAVAERCVRVREVKPGLSRLTVDGPTAQIVGAYNRVIEIATELQVANAGSGEDESTQGGSLPDDRTRAQVAADIVLDLLLTSAPDAHGTDIGQKTALAAITPTVHVTIPATTLTGVTAGGAEVVGHGPIDDDTARRLAGGAPLWFRLFTDPATGVPTSVDRYRPCTAQRALLRARDEHCRFPGCRRPARACDIDHTLAAADGGPTSLGNLACLCERHHTVKHHTDWKVTQRAAGVLEWTAPTRRVHTTRPPAAVRFVSDRPPARQRTGGGLAGPPGIPQPAPF